MAVNIKKLGVSDIFSILRQFSVGLELLCNMAFKPLNKTYISIQRIILNECLWTFLTETSPGEREDLELLERALEKALWVRTGTGHLTKDPNKQSAPKKEPHTSGVPPKEGRQTSAASRGKQTTRSTSRSGRFDRKEQKNSGGATGEDMQLRLVGWVRHHRV